MCELHEIYLIHIIYYYYKLPNIVYVSETFSCTPTPMCARGGPRDPPAPGLPAGTARVDAEGTRWVMGVWLSGERGGKRRSKDWR